MGPGWAQKRCGKLETRVVELERELESSICRGEDAADLEARVRTLERELSDAERKAEHAQMAAEDAEAAWDVEKASWASERALFGQEKEQWAELSATLESERELWELEREELTAQAKDQIVDAANGLHGLIQRFDIPLFRASLGLACSPMLSSGTSRNTMLKNLSNCLPQERKSVTR